MSREQTVQYLKNALTPFTSINRPGQLYAGDVCHLRVGTHGRGSERGVPFAMRVVPRGEVWKGRVFGKGIAGGAIHFPGDGHEISIMLPDLEGPVTFEFDLVVEYGEVAAKTLAADYGWQPDPEREAKARSVGEARFTFHGSRLLNLKPSRMPRPIFERTTASPSDFGDAKPYRAYWYSFPSGTIFEVWPDVEKSNGLGLAAEVFIRQSGREHRLGWTFVPRLRNNPWPLYALIRDFDLGQPAELIYRSSRGPLERPIWTPRLWAGEIVRPLVIDKRYKRKGPPPHVEGLDTTPQN